jgi:hypothetical protein
VQKAHSIHAAKTQLSRLVERAEKGEEVIIAFFESLPERELKRWE